ncbi:hypothetical protein HBO38_08530 [Pseudomonas veronii]|uniref:Uncharacterized protein n=1 Tax=Pseudomonas veronii TaxID=76761 RepID=A0A7Y1F7Y3_PSEVE|nr:hypothetical protein [Pseudomonas veronii]
MRRYQVNGCDTQRRQCFQFVRLGNAILIRVDPYFDTVKITAAGQRVDQRGIPRKNRTPGSGERRERRKAIFPNRRLASRYREGLTKPLGSIVDSPIAVGVKHQDAIVRPDPAHRAFCPIGIMIEHCVTL